ncbi:MAG: hypothetical protein CO099_05080 [Bdellovibrio sp. CG_4_9_14_3_um_filter_39_7]|nr:MAG: hypothetical protein COW78_09360 [Bdellovibrio sp. CG22_combo_CG10-13_8_21_14_all_39_27]PJB53824.1 MAG: hypothetical protein CO099_05080 [Bdellovibrio sp. CG_4_9_14_3_um_filter_39_7]
MYDKSISFPYIHMVQKIILFLSLLLSLSALAETWKINDDHSEISFKIPYLKITKVNGRFTKFQGEVDIKGTRLSSIKILISTSSIFTGNNIRDGHLKSSDFLKVKEFPHITFISSSVELISPKQYLAKGNLTIKDKTLPHQFQFELSEIIQDTWSFQNRFAKFKGKIKRHDFGINWDKSLSDNQYLIGEEIEISGQFQLQPNNQTTPTHKFMIPDTKFTRAKDRINRGEEIELPPSQPVVHESSLKEKPSPIEPDIQDMVIPGDKPSELDRNLTWWIAFLVLGMFGFMAAIGGAYWIKFKLSLSTNNEYSEEKAMGILSDLLAIALITVYAIAFWFVGWNG